MEDIVWTTFSKKNSLMKVLVFRSKCHRSLFLWIQLKMSQHYIDFIMTTITSQITSLTVVYSTVYSDADQRKHQSSASLAFVWGIHRDRWIPRTKGQLRGKCFHLMTSSCIGPDNGLARNRRQTITCTNADPLHWHIYAPLWNDELINVLYIFAHYTFW